MFTLLRRHDVTAVTAVTLRWKSNYFATKFWRLIISLASNISQQNFVVLLETHLELNVCNFVTMRSDLAFLSYII